MSFENFHYLLLLAGCLLITLPLEILLGARVWRQPKRMLLAMLPMLIIFIAWDALGIARGHWWYSERFITGIHIGFFPIEELLFFVVIPICALLSYEAVGRVFELARGTGPFTFTWANGLERGPHA